MIVDKQSLVQKITLELADNSTQEISPRDVRVNLLDIIDSVHLLTADQDLNAKNFATPDVRTTRAGDQALGKLKLAGYSSVDNSAFGYFALNGNYDGTKNTALGAYAISCNLYGSGNVGVGYNALAGNVFGSHNVAIGPHAIQTNKRGNFNIGIGHGAGYYIGENDSYKLFISSHDVNDSTMCDVVPGVGPVPLVYGDLQDLRLGVKVKTLHDFGVFQVGGHASPSSGGFYDLGHYSVGNDFKWRHAYLSNSINEIVYFNDSAALRVKGDIVPDTTNIYSIGDSGRGLLWDGYFNDITVSGVANITDLRWTTITDCTYDCRTLYLASSGLCDGSTTAPCGYLSDTQIEGGGVVLQSSGTDYKRDYHWTFRSPDYSQTCLTPNLAGDNSAMAHASWYSNISLLVESGRHIRVDRHLGRDDVSILNDNSCYGMFIKKDSDVLRTGIPSQNEQQKVWISAGGGSFKLSFKLTDEAISQTTASIAYNASADTIKDKLEALSNIGVGNIRVSGPNTLGLGTGEVIYLVEFIGTLSKQDFPLMAVDKTDLDGTTTGGGTVCTTTTGSNEVQVLEIRATGGRFTMTYGGNTNYITHTSFEDHPDAYGPGGEIVRPELIDILIPASVSASVLQEALEAKIGTTIAVSRVTVSGGWDHTITFSGNLEKTNLPQLSSNNHDLVGSGGITGTKNETQVIRVQADGGKWRIGWRDDETAGGAFTWSVTLAGLGATASDVAAALIPLLGAGNFTVTGGYLSGITSIFYVEFKNDLGNQNINHCVAPGIAPNTAGVSYRNQTCKGLITESYDPDPLTAPGKHFSPNTYVFCDGFWDKAPGYGAVRGHGPRDRGGWQVGFGSQWSVAGYDSIHSASDYLEGQYRINFVVVSVGDTMVGEFNVDQKAELIETFLQTDWIVPDEGSDGKLEDQNPAKISAAIQKALIEAGSYEILVTPTEDWYGVDYSSVYNDKIGDYTEAFNTSISIGDSRQLDDYAWERWDLWSGAFGAVNYASDYTEKINEQDDLMPIAGAIHEILMQHRLKIAARYNSPLKLYRKRTVSTTLTSYQVTHSLRLTGEGYDPVKGEDVALGFELPPTSTLTTPAFTYGGGDGGNRLTTDEHGHWPPAEDQRNESLACHAPQAGSFGPEGLSETNTLRVRLEIWKMNRWDNVHKHDGTEDLMYESCEFLSSNTLEQIQTAIDSDPANCENPNPYGIDPESGDYTSPIRVSSYNRDYGYASYASDTVLENTSQSHFKDGVVFEIIDPLLSERTSTPDTPIGWRNPIELNYKVVMRYYDINGTPLVAGTQVLGESSTESTRGKPSTGWHRLEDGNSIYHDDDPDDCAFQLSSRPHFIQVKEHQAGATMSPALTLPDTNGGSWVEGSSGTSGGAAVESQTLVDGSADSTTCTDVDPTYTGPDASVIAHQDGALEIDKDTCPTNVVYVTEEGLIEPSPLTPAGKIGNITDVNFISSGCKPDYTVSYASIESGVSVGQRLVSRTKTTKSVSTSEPIVGFDLRYRDEKDEFDTVTGQTKDRLTISPYDNTTVSVGAITMMRDNNVGLVGINDLPGISDDVLPETIFNIQSTGVPIARVTGGEGASVQLLGGSNKPVDGVEINYTRSTQRADIHMFRNADKQLAVSITNRDNNVGIGTVMASEKLTVASGAHHNAAAALQESSGTIVATSSYGKLYVRELVADNQCQTIYFLDDCGNEFDLVGNKYAASGDRIYTDADCNTHVGNHSPDNRGTISDRDQFGNTSLGGSALRDLNYGDENIGIGCGAGSGVTTGYRNILIGNHAGAAGTITTGSNNIILGHRMDVGNSSYTMLLGTDKGLFVSGIMGPNTSDRELLLPQGKFSITSEDEFDKLTLTPSGVNLTDGANQYPDHSMDFIFTGPDGDDVLRSNTLLSLKHNVAPMSSTCAFSEPATERPYAQLSGDLRLQGAIRFCDGTSINSAGDIVLEAGSGIRVTKTEGSNTTVHLGIDTLPINSDANASDFYLAIASGESHSRINIAGLADYITPLAARIVDCVDGQVGYRYLFTNNSTLGDSGCNSVYMGNEAGHLSNGWNHSVMIGTQAGKNATIAYSSESEHASLFIGHQAGEDTVGCWSSTFIGPGAGFNADNSYRSTFIGDEAGQNANSNRSVGIGDNALEGVVGTHNIEITTGIGHDGGAPWETRMINGTVSNALNIGDFIAGDTYNRRLSIGDATLSPDAVLSVRKDAYQGHNNTDYIQTWWCNGVKVAGLTCDGKLEGGGVSDSLIEGLMDAALEGPATWGTKQTATMTKYKRSGDDMVTDGNAVITNIDPDLDIPNSAYVIARLIGTEYRPIWVSCNGHSA